MLSEGAIVVSRGTLAEFTTVIRRLAKDEGRNGNAEARSAMAALRSHRAYRAAADVSEDEIAALFQRDTKLTFVDAWNIIAAARESEPLASFDKPVRSYARK